MSTTLGPVAAENTDGVRVLVIIPGYNEERNIRRVVKGIRAVTDPRQVDILVVNDGSSDQTESEALAGGAMVVTLLQNLGYGYALQTGYRYALEENYTYILQMDGDGQHSPESIPALLGPVLSGAADLVIGSRSLSKTFYPMPLARKVGQRLFSAILRVVGNLSIQDVTSGYQCCNRPTFQLFTTKDFPGDYPDADVLLFLAMRGMKVREVAATFRVNQDGKSMHGGIVKPAYYIYKMLFSMLLVTIRHRHLLATKKDEQ